MVGVWPMIGAPRDRQRSPSKYSAAGFRDFTRIRLQRIRPCGGNVFLTQQGRHNSRYWVAFTEEAFFGVAAGDPHGRDGDHLHDYFTAPPCPIRRGNYRRRVPATDAPNFLGAKLGPTNNPGRAACGRLSRLQRKR